MDGKRKVSIRPSFPTQNICYCSQLLNKTINRSYSLNRVCPKLILNKRIFRKIEFQIFKVLLYIFVFTGYYCVQNATHFSPFDGTTGDKCPTGHYCPEASSGGIPCPAGYYLDTTKSTQFSDCRLCTLGMLYY